MRVLNLFVLLFVVFSLDLLSNEKNASFDKYISKNKKEQFRLDYEKNEAESSILRDSWIAPINLNYSYSKSNPYDDIQKNQSSAIKMDQPIFRSGGIYYGIKFAHASRKYSDYSIDVAKRKMIKDAIAILMQIKQTDLKILKQELQIKNSKINLELKREQYLNGQLDSGFLDNAIIERNFVIQTLYDLQTAKEKLISAFKTLSDLHYKDVKTPHLELLTQDEFLKYNIVMKMSRSKVEKDRYAKDVTVAKYLPQISFQAGYNWNKDEAPPVYNSLEKDYYNYGIRATIPLDINSFRDIQSARIDFLKSKVIEIDKQRELIAIFELVQHNINNLEKKKSLSLENKEIYLKLLEDTRKLFSAGYKTEYDVETLQNSVNISELNAKIFEYDKQLELLTLYEMYVNEK
jgi:outer membrane protein TolC